MRVRARWGLLAGLAISACECGEPAADSPPDLSLLIGEGMFERDIGVDAEALDASGADGGRDLGSLDLGRPDLSGPDLGIRDAPADDLGANDAGDPCSAPTEASLGAAEVLMRASALAGRLVEVVGTATMGSAECTSMPCMGGGACCNTCRAPLLVDGALPLARGPCVGTATIACIGGACDPLVCSPPVIDVPASFVGRVRTSPARLELIRLGP